MERLGIVALALLAVVVQTTLMPGFPGAGALMDLVLLLVIFFALQRGTTLGIWMGFVLGLIQDAAGGGPLGLNAVALLGVAYLVGLMRARLFKENYPAQVMVVVALTFFHQFLMFYWLNTVMDASFGIGDWLRRALIMSCSHALVGPFLFHWLATWIAGDDVYQHLIAGDSQSRRRFFKRFV
ncbi:MAG: rod shape-determining protein MreD [Candidatus Firestonebacteria bacterium]|nr:rod shape-determining protein MreD [Candidatus Firestonebacteria bacterium]